ncbi:MAG TPA: flagellar biosynthetic protein FliO [Geobacter sp.]|nr:flagellar biosynthetic protein FliO [Geobacter sp.]
MKKLAFLLATMLSMPAVARAEGTPGSELLGSLAQMVGSLILVIGIILILYYLAGRFMKVPQAGGFRYIRVVETRHLAPKKSLMLVEVAGEYLLLSNSGDGVSFIKQVEMLEEIEVVDERGYATLIPVQLRKRLQAFAGDRGEARLGQLDKSGGLA